MPRGRVDPKQDQCKNMGHGRWGQNQWSVRWSHSSPTSAADYAEDHTKSFEAANICPL